MRGATKEHSLGGGYIMDLAGMLEEQGRGFSRVASVGNEADVSIPDILRNFASHEETRAVLAYSEDFSSADALFGAVEEIVKSGRELVMMTPRSGMSTSTMSISGTSVRPGSL